MEQSSWVAFLTTREHWLEANPLDVANRLPSAPPRWTSRSCSRRSASLSCKSVRSGCRAEGQAGAVHHAPPKPRAGTRDDHRVRSRRVGGGHPARPHSAADDPTVVRPSEPRRSTPTRATAPAITTTLRPLKYWLHRAAVSRSHSGYPMSARLRACLSPTRRYHRWYYERWPNRSPPV